MLTNRWLIEIVAAVVFSYMVVTIFWQIIRRVERRAEDKRAKQGWTRGKKF